MKEINIEINITMKIEKILLSNESDELINILKQRFEKNFERHETLNWEVIEKKLKSQKTKLWSINEMEKSGGEPDVLTYNSTTNSYIFFDCSKESPIGRRSLCYDAEAQNSRKEFAPKNNVIDVANEMGIELLDEFNYRALQQKIVIDTKTSSWIKTPSEIRKLGGAIFADYRYGQVFVYHNGASSYYASRGFRSFISI